MLGSNLLCSLTTLKFSAISFGCFRVCYKFVQFYIFTDIYGTFIMQYQYTAQNTI